MIWLESLVSDSQVKLMGYIFGVFVGLCSDSETISGR